MSAPACLPSTGIDDEMLIVLPNYFAVQGTIAHIVTQADGWASRSTLPLAFRIDFVVGHAARMAVRR